MMEYPKYKKVLFCTDFSENSDYAFKFAFGIAKRDEGLLYILHVIPRNQHQEMIRRYVPENTLRNIQKGIEQEVVVNYKEHYTKKIEDAVRFEVVTKQRKRRWILLSWARTVKQE